MAEMSKPAKPEDSAVYGGFIGALGIIFALAFPARFRFPFDMSYGLIYYDLMFGGQFRVALPTALLLALFGLPSLVLGIAALARIKRSQGALTGRTLTLAGVTFGTILTLCSSLLLIGPLGTYFETKHAITLLEAMRGRESEWMYGDIVHKANIFLGRMALQKGKTNEAKHYLLQAGKTPGSPVLGSFGPDMTLAKELLEKGERKAVIEYLELCAKFWKSGKGRLTWWKSTLEAGGIPDFNAPETVAKPPERYTLRVVEASHAKEIEAYGPEGTAPRRPGQGRMWLVLQIEVAAQWAREGLKFDEMVVLDEAGIGHAAVAITGPPPEGSLRPRFLFLEEAFKPWRDPIRPSNISSWVYSYKEEKRSEISFVDSDRRLVFSITRGGRVKFLSEEPEKPARLFLLFALPAEGKQFELRLAEHAREAVSSIAAAPSKQVAIQGTAAPSAKDEEKQQKAQIARWAQACDAGGVEACYGLGSHYRFGKEYGKAAAAFQKACDGGHGATACSMIGDMYREGQGVQKDDAKAVALYKKGCEADDLSDYKYQACWRLAKYGPGELDRTFSLYDKACKSKDAAACYILGVFYSGTLGTVANRLGEGGSHARADALFQKACDGGHAMACYTFGSRIRVRTGLPKYMETALASFQKACDGGVRLACTNLGEMYRDGQGVPKDESRAAALLRRGEALQNKEYCDGGIVESCASLIDLYERGEGVPKDLLTRPVALLQKACDGGESRGCTSLALMYERGIGVPKDLARAAALQKQVCDEGGIGGCRNLAVMYRDGLGVPKDPVRAVSLLKQLCEKWGGSCADLGYMYEHGQGVPKDEAQAAALYKKGCDGGNASGCARLGWMYFNGTGVPKDEAQAVSLFKRGCDAGYAWACTNLGLAHFRGVGVPRDPPRAATIYKLGCDGGEATACGNLGMMYRYGQGIPKDESRALTLFQQACRGGHAPACQELKQRR